MRPLLDLDGVALRSSAWALEHHRVGDAAGGEESDEEQRQPGEAAAAMPRESTGGAVQETHELVLASRRGGLLDEVDHGEEPDPDHIDEVPVVGDDDRADRLLVGEPAWPM